MRERMSVPAARVYYCPQCCREVFESVYITVTGRVVGCDRCLRERAVEVVLSGEAV